jgi:hypothetical protein
LKDSEGDVRARLFALSWTIATILAFASPIHAQDADSQAPVSIERIRAALVRQPTPILQVPAPSGDRPTFHVEVQEQLFVVVPIREEPLDLTYGLPSAGELLWMGIEKIRSTVVAYNRRRAEQRARKEVDEALAAFCAVHECSPLKTRK